MSNPTVDELVGDYLARLEEAARDLPAGRRTELLDEIREHIDAGRETGAASDEAAVRTMLDRLGEPEDIAAAALAEDAGWQPAAAGAPPAPVGVPSPSGTGLELAAVLLLTVGSIIPVVGWAVGVVLLWASRLWRTWEKVLGTLVVPGGPGLFFWFGIVFGVRTCTGSATRDPGAGTILESRTCTVAGFPAWLGTALLVAALVAPLVVGAVLYSRARARAATEPAVLQPAPDVPTAGRAEPAARSPWGGSEIASVILLAASTVFAIALFGPAGVVLALLALIAGLVFVWSSPQWTQREKRIATVVAAVPPAVALLGVVAFTMMWRVM